MLFVCKNPRHRPTRKLSPAPQTSTASTSHGSYVFPSQTAPFLPSVTISGYKSAQDNSKGNSADLYIEPKERSLLVEQKIFQGFSGVANLQKKRKGQKIRELKLKKAEQEILLETAKVHTKK